MTSEFPRVASRTSSPSSFDLLSSFLRVSKDLSSASMLLHTALGNENDDNDLEDSDGLELVPASSSPMASSPFPETPPHVDASTPPEIDVPDFCFTKPAWAPQAIASAHTTATNPTSWTKESQERSLSVSDCDAPEGVEHCLAGGGINSPSEHTSFASRLHELLLVAQQELRRTVPFSSCVDASSTAPLDSADDVADSPDYWSYFPESTSMVISCDNDSLDASSGSDSTSSVYSRSGNYATEPDHSNSAYMQSLVPLVDPGLIKTAISTPVLPRKRSLDSARSLTPTDHISCNLDSSLADHDEPRRKRIKREDSLQDVLSTHSKYFSRKPSLDIAIKQRSLEDESAGFLPKRRMYARRAASLRRADSLRSEAASSVREWSKVELKVSLHLFTQRTSPQTRSQDAASPIKAETSEDEALTSDWEADTPYSYVPTEPATPVAAGARGPRRRALSGPSPTPPRSPMPVPLPIVAPPPFSEIPSAPLNEEDAAERRIKMLVERETEERRADGLDRIADLTDDETAPHVKRHQASDGEEQQENKVALKQRSSSADGTSEHAQSKFAQTEEPSLCIDENIRTECIDWILEVGIFTPVVSYGSRMRNRYYLTSASTLRASVYNSTRNCKTRMRRGGMPRSFSRATSTASRPHARALLHLRLRCASVP